ncbi:putative toxin-antitoxin system toxin component, PIN family [Alkalinema sp. FACHB-956]|uniref:putative toxin-antitoxin system toxin component, PIN family n=1 Tax=Alkalinema sp. FACHB-956 TaxID=2692768 RepID=UPI0016846B0C|nr:putative toxin-antitoxin system toxin component, PIN family [Alkalinema sp. FACHB-956]
MKTTLERPKFQAQLTRCNQTPDRLYAIAQQISSCIAINNISIPQLRDQNDTKILATAIVAEAEVLITGDLDLLVLNPFESIEIMNPIDFQRNYCR